MRKRLSYANVTATLALVFAMSGGALAANHYLINSTKQINPKVLKKLTGKPGKTGAAGATGAAGKEGPQGPTGKEGAAGKEGLTGKEGAAGSAVGYALVLENGEVPGATAKGVSTADVTHPSTGNYCFSKLGFTPHNADVTLNHPSTRNGIVEEVSTAVGVEAEAESGPGVQAYVFVGSVEPKVFTSGLDRYLLS